MFNFEDSELTLASLLGESSKAGDKRSFGKKTVEAKRRKNVAVQLLCGDSQGQIQETQMATVAGRILPPPEP